MFQLFRRSTFILSVAPAVLALTQSCGVVGDLTDQLQDLADQSQAAFEDVRATAEAEGGAAALVTPASETNLEISDETSPIFGAGVLLVAGSLPEGVTLAVVSIVPASVSGAGFHTAAAPATLYVASGPGVEIKLQSLPDLTVIQPVLDATVTVPLQDAPEDVTVEEAVVVAHLRTNGEIDALTGTVDAAGTRVSGDTPDFSPFVAARQRVITPPAPAPVLFAYEVTRYDNGDVLCEGAINLNTESAMLVTFETQDNSSISLFDIFFANDDVEFSYRMKNCNTHTSSLPGATGIDPNGTGSCFEPRLEFKCENEWVLYNGDGPFTSPRRDVAVSNFKSSSSSRIDCYLSDTECDRHVGTVDLDIDLQFHSYTPQPSSAVATIQFKATAEATWDVVDQATLPAAP